MDAITTLNRPLATTSASQSADMARQSWLTRSIRTIGNSFPAFRSLLQTPDSVKKNEIITSLNSAKLKIKQEGRIAGIGEHLSSLNKHLNKIWRKNDKLIKLLDSGRNNTEVMRKIEQNDKDVNELLLSLDGLYKSLGDEFAKKIKNRKATLLYKQLFSTWIYKEKSDVIINIPRLSPTFMVQLEKSQCDARILLEMQRLNKMVITHFMTRAGFSDSRICHPLPASTSPVATSDVQMLNTKMIEATRHLQERRQGNSRELKAILQQFREKLEQLWQNVSNNRKLRDNYCLCGVEYAHLQESIEVDRIKVRILLNSLNMLYSECKKEVDVKQAGACEPPVTVNPLVRQRIHVIDSTTDIEVICARPYFFQQLRSLGLSDDVINIFITLNNALEKHYKVDLLKTMVSNHN